MLETIPLHHLTRVISLLSHGQIVAYPTGTSYGLGVHALDQRALERLHALKKRSPDKTYTVLLPDRAPERFVDWTDDERRVFIALRNRPLTMLARAKQPLRHLEKDGRVGIRTPDHPFTRELTAVLPFPITATSANVSGESAACGPLDLEALAQNTRLYAVEGGSLPKCLPSTIVAWESGQWRIVRAGDVTESELLEGAVITQALWQRPASR